MDYINSTIESLVKNGIFGPVEFDSVSYEEDVEKGIQLMSSIHFVTINLKTGGKKITQKVVIKVMPEPVEGQADFEIDTSFKNEIFAYKTMLPYLNVEKIDIFPKMFYGKFINEKYSKETILILDDLREKGFTLAKEKYILDYDHLSMMMRNLGKFHALSHIAKENNPTEFYKYTSQLPNNKFQTNPDEFQLMCEISMKRGFLPSYNKGIETDKIDQLFERLKSVSSFLKKLLEPEEPFSVVCHGDFNKNNVLFNYDENDRPTDIKFFDLSDLYYTTPAIDVAFTLYMNTTKEDRCKHWDDYLRIYWEGLLNILPNPKFSYNEFYEHFCKRAIFGYIPCSFFLPMVMSVDLTDRDFYFKMSVEEKRIFFETMGGDEATSAIADIVHHLIDKQYFQKYFDL